MADLGLDELIGVPFVRGARGPDAYDCWGLVRELYKREHGITPPDYNDPQSAPLIAAMLGGGIELWKAVPFGTPGSVGLFRVMTRVSCESRLHVGYILRHDLFAHTWESSGGVTIERLTPWKRRTVGCYSYVGA
jgi:cell wall-associated NlpC family hydrolase